MKYYVYELINSLDNKPFYIGKGTNRRMYMHEYYAKKDSLAKYQSKKLRNKIRSIWNNNGKIIYSKIFSTNDNNEAFIQETKRIKELGIENLCNIWLTPPILEEVYKMRAKKMIGHKTSNETKQKIRQSLMGHIVKQSTKQKISECHRGKPRPCTDAKRISIANARKPEGGFPNVISPSGEIFHIDILSDFCREHNLHLPAMCGLIKRYKNVKSHKGWRLS